MVLDGEGRELARAEDEGAVVTAERPDDAAQAVRRAVEAALRQCRRTTPVDVLWSGLAGAGTAAPRAAVTRALRRLDLAERLIVGTDVEAAFYDAFEDGPGLLLIAGTGSIVWVRDSGGVERRVGGWGRALGDEGSGYWIGLEGLRALTRSEDGRADVTAMREPLLERCGVDAVDDLVGWVEKATKGEVASLAPQVIRCADEGDEGARTIVDAAVDELAALVSAALGKWAGGEARDSGEAGESGEAASGGGDVVLWGGLVAPGGPLRRRMVRRIEGLGFPVREGDVDPPLGAARLARASSRV